ncbi:hypothetical protein PFISCL1PPCAC_25920, partial [Pristionchus fissidentatus]
PIPIWRCYHILMETPPPSYNELFECQPSIVTIPIYDKNKARKARKIAKFHMLVTSISAICIISWAFYVATGRGKASLFINHYQLLFFLSLTPLPCVVSGYWGMKGRQANFILPLIIYTAIQLVVFTIFSFSCIIFALYCVVMSLHTVAVAPLFLFLFILLPALIQSYHGLNAFIAVRQNIIDNKDAFRLEQARALVLSL